MRRWRRRRARGREGCNIEPHPSKIARKLVTYVLGGSKDVLLNKLFVLEGST